MKEQNLTCFLNILFSNHIPFAAFSWPGSKNTKLIIQNTPEINELSNITYIGDLKGFIIHPFDNSKHRIYFINNDFETDESLINNETIRHFENIKFGINPLQTEPEYIITREEYFKQVKFIKHTLRIHKIKKGGLLWTRQ